MPDWRRRAHRTATRAPGTAMDRCPDPGTHQPWHGHLLDRAPGLAFTAPPDPFRRLPAAFGAAKARRRLRHGRTIATGSDIRQAAYLLPGVSRPRLNPSATAAARSLTPSFA